jgi:hypothetical protein
VPTVTMRIAAMVVIRFLKKSIELMVVGSIVNEFFLGSIHFDFPMIGEIITIPNVL